MIDAAAAARRPAPPIDAWREAPRPFSRHADAVRGGAPRCRTPRLLRGRGPATSGALRVPSARAPRLSRPSPSLSAAPPYEPPCKSSFFNSTRSRTGLLATLFGASESSSFQRLCPITILNFHLCRIRPRVTQRTSTWAAILRCSSTQSVVAAAPTSPS